jgi:hypothetical protein
VPVAVLRPAGTPTHTIRASFAGGAARCGQNMSRPQRRLRLLPLKLVQKLVQKLLL